MRMVVVLLALTGCAEATGHGPDDSIEDTVYQCDGGREVGIGYDRWGPGTADIFRGDLGYVLDQVPAPPGVIRYQGKGDDLGYDVWEVTDGVGTLMFHEADTGRNVVHAAGCRAAGA